MSINKSDPYLARDIAIVVLMIPLAGFGFFMMFNGTGFLDYEIRNGMSCERIVERINDPFNLHTSLTDQEMREVYRDKGCLDHDKIREDIESRRGQ